MATHILYASILLIGVVILYPPSPQETAKASITLKHNDSVMVNLGQAVCTLKTVHHVMALSWKVKLTGGKKDVDGYLPAPPHDETGHTGIILTLIFFND